MEIEVTEINMNNNLTPQYVSTSPSPVAYFTGLKEITFKGKVVDSKDLEKIFTQSIEIDRILSPRGYLLRCYLTDYSYADGEDTFVEGIAEGLDPTIDVNFLDGKRTIEVSQYNTVLKNHGKLEEMTFNQFNDFIMIEEL